MGVHADPSSLVTSSNTLNNNTPTDCIVFVCPMHCDSSCVGQTIKLLGPIACRMSVCRVSYVVCPAVGVVTINHAHLLDRPLLVTYLISGGRKF